MRSPRSIPPAEFDQMITEAVDEYMREVRHAHRLMLRQQVRLYGVTALRDSAPLSNEPVPLKAEGTNYG